MLDSFISQCRTAVTEPDPIPTIRQALEELVSSPEALALAHPAPTDCAVISGATEYLFEDDTLTVALVHTPPGTLQPPHDHTIPAIIGGYAGTELHRMFRRVTDDEAPIAPSGTTDTGPGDVLSLGSAAVHAIDAAPGQWASAVHVYLGGLSSTERSIFHPDTLAEEPLTMERYDEWCRPTPPAPSAA